MTVGIWNFEKVSNGGKYLPDTGNNGDGNKANNDERDQPSSNESGKGVPPTDSIDPNDNGWDEDEDDDEDTYLYEMLTDGPIGPGKPEDEDEGNTNDSVGGSDEADGGNTEDTGDNIISSDEE
ncbi:uncharacterized protein [Hyperolius riggenbachi]|uniref:uncharacterized protein n=1 Tax=Hyperolius riggenbachi TaxID=752182 RepID=UPI0035A3BA88